MACKGRCTFNVPGNLPDIFNDWLRWLVKCAYSAHMEIYPDCTEALTLRCSELLDLTRNSELFVVMANPEIEDMDKPFRQSPTEINRPTLLNYPALGNVRRTRFFQSIR